MLSRMCRRALQVAYSRQAAGRLGVAFSGYCGFRLSLNEALLRPIM